MSPFLRHYLQLALSHQAAQCLGHNLFPYINHVRQQSSEVINEDSLLLTGCLSTIGYLLLLIPRSIEFCQIPSVLLKVSPKNKIYPAPEIYTRTSAVRSVMIIFSIIISIYLSLYHLSSFFSNYLFLPK